MKIPFFMRQPPVRMGFSAPFAVSERERKLQYFGTMGKQAEWVVQNVAFDVEKTGVIT